MLILGQFATNEPFFEAPVEFVEALRAAMPGDAEFRACRTLDEFRRALPDAVGIVGYPFPSAWLRVAHSLRFVHLLTAGVPEGIESACGDRIALTNSVGANADSVAEHALFLVLAAVRGVSVDSLRVWDPEATRPARTLAGCGVTIVGFGPVGQRLSTLLAPIVGRTVVVSRSPRSEPRLVTGFEDLERSVHGADVVVLALPNRPETRELFGDRFYAALRPDVALVNVGRGALVDEVMLLAFLDAHPDARYLADVAVPEPYPVDGPLRRSAQVILTPHVGGRSVDLWPALGRIASHVVRDAVRAIIAAEVG